MSKTEYAIFIVLVFLAMTGAFFNMTSEENWDAGQSSHRTAGK